MIDPIGTSLAGLLGSPFRPMDAPLRGEGAEVGLEDAELDGSLDPLKSLVRPAPSRLLPDDEGCDLLDSWASGSLGVVLESLGLDDDLLDPDRPVIRSTTLASTLGFFDAMDASLPESGMLMLTSWSLENHNFPHSRL